MDVVKSKVFQIGDQVETELYKGYLPRHYYNEFLPSSGIWIIGSVNNIVNVSDGPELVVEFGERFGTHHFPLDGHTQCVNTFWYRSGSLRHYNSGATRTPSCDFCSITDLGSLPYLGSTQDDYYRSHFRKQIMTSYKRWPTCKIEQKTLDIKYYLINEGTEIKATFECQNCCY